ncbi:MAG: chorismate synthase [Oligoflexia bacterium]|nr:chorismate synthase [Oligoflexia bacterium]
MASNSFGEIFRITTWGESHGKEIGVVIDGCPAGLEISEDEINVALIARAPGRTSYTSPRREEDNAKILSGIFNKKTTGAPICIVIKNSDADSSKYESISNLLRPGHANFTYLEKYKIFDYRGGGRASARETACRVAAGAVAKKLLYLQGIKTQAYLFQVGNIRTNVLKDSMIQNDSMTQKNSITQEVLMPEILTLLNDIKNAGDSIGGVVEFITTALPVGLGDPVYGKLPAKLASAMMSIPGAKGFEIGEGFNSADMLGSQYNDNFTKVNEDNDASNGAQSNHCGGTLGGISNGMPIYGKVAFKPTSSIALVQNTLTTTGEAATLKLPEGSRHDPCIAIRSVPVVDAMLAIVLIDCLLLNKGAYL